MNMDEAIQVSCIIDKLPPSWKDFKHTLIHKKGELTLVELGSHLRIEESLRDDDVAWWVNSKPTVHVCKDICWFKTYESLNDGSILHMENESTTLVHGRGYVDLRFSSGKIVSLFNVLHVPNIRKNLVSSRVLNNCGYKQVIESNNFVLSKHGEFIGFGYLSNQMFRLNIVNDNIGSAFMSTSKLNDSILWHARLGHVHYKRMQDMSMDGLILAFDIDTEKFCYVYLLHSKDEASDIFKVFKTEVELQQGSLIKIFKTDRGGLSQGFWGEAMVWGCRAAVRLPDPKLKSLGKRGIECIFVGYAEHSKALVLRPSLMNLNGTKDIGSLVVSEEVTEEDDPKIFDKAMKSQAVAFWKEAINGEMDSIMGNNTWVLADLPPCCKPIGCKWIFKIKLKVDGTIEKFKARLVDLTKEFLSSRFSVKDMGEVDVILGIRIKHECNGIAISQSYYVEKVLKKFNYFDCIPVSIPMDTSEKLMPNNGQAVSQLEYSRVIGYLMYAMTCTRPDIAFVVGKLSSYTSYPGTQH
ncbi:zinc finger, CCHC-type containing protein [Tanacetum coccineum]